MIQPEGDGKGLEPGLSVPSSGCRYTLWPAEGGVHPVGPLPLRAVRRLSALHAPALPARLLPAATRRGPDIQKRRSRPRPLPNLRTQGLRFPTLGKNWADEGWVKKTLRPHTHAPGYRHTKAPRNTQNTKPQTQNPWATQNNSGARRQTEAQR